MSAKFRIGDHVRIIKAMPAQGLTEPPVGAEGYVLGYSGKRIAILGAPDGDAFVMDEEQLELIP